MGKHIHVHNKITNKKKKKKISMFRIQNFLNVFMLITLINGTNLNPLKQIAHVPHSQLEKLKKLPFYLITIQFLTLKDITNLNMTSSKFQNIVTLDKSNQLI